ncbi:MAG: hypothetical protein SF053_02325 [Bacteroidia bacterium]|jgi:hypothetical protein|nr:hypothetical protein [Bacteroidia bacterium]
MQQYTWIYTLSEPLTDDAATALQEAFDQFTRQWKSHGDLVTGRIELHAHRFVTVQADPAQHRPSGCSIDTMRRTVTEILTQRSLTWLDASWIAWRDKDHHIRTVHYREIAALIRAGEMGPDTLVFDHSLGQSDDLSRWELPLAQTWMARFLPTPA